MWAAATFRSSQHLSILVKIRAIPCVSNYLDPAVSLNSQRGRKALASLALTSVNYSKSDETLEKVSVDSRFAGAYLGRLFFGVAQKLMVHYFIHFSNCFRCWLARLWTVMSCKSNPRLRRFLVIVVSRAEGTV